jgi:hypothetical protein
MSFRSSLLAVWRLRKSLERMAWLRLQQVNAQMRLVTLRAQQVEVEMSRAREETAVQLRVGMESSVLQVRSLAWFKQERERLERAKSELVEQVRSAQAEYRRRQTDREKIESVIAGRRAAYEYASARREDARVDEAHLQRRAREGTKSNEGEEQLTNAGNRLAGSSA